MRSTHADTNTTDNASAFNKVNYEETDLLSMPVLRDDHQHHSTNNATAVTNSTTTTTTRLSLSTQNRSPDGDDYDQNHHDTGESSSSNITSNRTSTSTSTTTSSGLFRMNQLNFTKMCTKPSSSTAPSLKLKDVRELAEALLLFQQVESTTRDDPALQSYLPTPALLSAMNSLKNLHTKRKWVEIEDSDDNDDSPSNKRMKDEFLIRPNAVAALATAEASSDVQGQPKDDSAYLPSLGKQCIRVPICH